VREIPSAERDFSPPGSTLEFILRYPICDLRFGPALPITRYVLRFPFHSSQFEVSAFVLALVARLPSLFIHPMPPIGPITRFPELFSCNLPSLHVTKSESMASEYTVTNPEPGTAYTVRPPPRTAA